MSDNYVLDIVGVLEGTDKSSSFQSCWDYLRRFQTVFRHLQDEPFNLIEIGVAGGASLKVWKSYFRKATIIGIDISPFAVRFAEDRVRIEIGSQDNPEFLARVCAAYPPTIIIDDGSHLEHHNIYTFERMYPSLLPGGFYVVEDLALHFGPDAKRWRSFEGISPVDYFGDLVKDRMVRSLPTDSPAWGTKKYIFDNTDAITVINGAIIFEKRKPRLAVEDAEEFAAGYLAANSYDTNALGRLADYFQHHWRGSAQAERAARKALEMSPTDADALERLGRFLFDQGRRNEAAIHYEGAVAAYIKRIETEAGLDNAWRGDIHYDISFILDRLGRPADALPHAQAAVKLASKGDWREAQYSRHLAAVQSKVSG